MDSDFLTSVELVFTQEKFQSRQVLLWQRKAHLDVLAMFLSSLICSNLDKERVQN